MKRKGLSRDEVMLLGFLRSKPVFEFMDRMEARNLLAGAGIPRRINLAWGSLERRGCILKLDPDGTIVARFLEAHRLKMFKLVLGTIAELCRGQYSVARGAAEQLEEMGMELEGWGSGFSELYTAPPIDPTQAPDDRPEKPKRARKAKGA